MIDFGHRLLALSMNGGVGKLLLARELNVYELVAIDCVAMNVSDLIRVNAEPLACVDYTAARHQDLETWGAIGRSLAMDCAQAGISLGGVESASSPDMVTRIAISGTTIASLPRYFQLIVEAVCPGVIIIGVSLSWLINQSVGSRGMSTR